MLDIPHEECRGMNGEDANSTLHDKFATAVTMGKDTMKFKRSERFEEIFEIEHASELCCYSANDVQLWPAIRTKIYSLVTSAEMGYSKAHAVSSIWNILNPKYIADVFDTGSFFLSQDGYYDSVFFTTARYLQYDREKKVYYNSFFQPYYNLFSDPLIFEASYKFDIKKPREFETSTFLNDYLIFGSIIKSSGLRITSNKIDSTLSKFARQICMLYSIPNLYATVYNTLRREVYSAIYLEHYVDRIVSHMNGNSAFVHCASYMGDTGVITKRFKEHGVSTIELQHGYVGPEHYAYNYPSGNADRAMKDYLPDYYLTFGKYWGEQIQTPSTIVTVGNPTLNNSADDLQKEVSPQSNSILVVSQGTVTAKMVKIAKYLSQALPKHTIMFKLHPGEVPFTQRYEDLKKYHNVQIRTYDNIYELIASSEIIVGYNSTTLFEAVAFDGKRIFILNNDLIPDSLGYKFSSCEELCDAILDGESGYPSAQPSYFWEPDWETNIASFLKSLSL
ncbi:MAG TPA: hypothetical protein DCX03_00530 [Bacteroidales bacterium]|nr:hypothetical protein [Bacteroidales bacterium]